jgi:thiosulfate reductase cytochrome b subunit
MMKTKKVYIYYKFERFWHWSQAALIFLLMLTGFEIHSSYSLFGFQNAVEIHNIAAWAFIILIIFAIFWHISTDAWKQYIPTSKNLKAQINYYLLGIFKNAPHPTKKTVLSKLNPLQRLVYLGLKILIIPLMLITGLLYIYYRYPHRADMKSIGIEGLERVALIHTLGAFLLVAFVIVHLYLITTGHTPTSNLKAMITGWEEIEDEEDTNEHKISNVSEDLLLKSKEK